MSKQVSTIEFHKLLQEAANSDLTFHRVRTALWSKFVKTTLESKTSKTQIDLDQWLLLKQYLTARNDKCSDELSLSFEKCLIALTEQFELAQEADIVTDDEHTPLSSMFRPPSKRVSFAGKSEQKDDVEEV